MTWFIECENGSRSRGHDTLEQAQAALRAMRSVQARLDPNYSEPVRFVSSEDEERPLEVEQVQAGPTANRDA